MLLATILLFSACGIGLTSAHPAESQNFKTQHTGVDFPVGYADLDAEGNSVRVVYPAMENGEGQAMAGNGPFPYTVFFVDEGENNDDYGIISGEIVKRGTIVVITNDFDSDDTANVVQSLSLIESIVELMNTTNSTNNLIPSSFGNIDLNHWGVSGHGVGLSLIHI